MRHKWLSVVTASGVLSLIIAGCGQSQAQGSSGHPTAQTVVDIKTAMVKGHNEPVLTNAKGDTLYYFTKDTASHSACTGSCALIWPPLLAKNGISAPASIKSHFSILHDPNGPQVEYNGHLLYRYSGDTGPLQTHGEGLFGAWFVATPHLGQTGSQMSSHSSSMMSNSPSSSSYSYPSSSSSSSGSGYGY
ncbi:hypothetical protein [Sulfobacillus thermosulfidooxidans]|uniref:COG4315 family predicted lipoprotein n=1 Tax=Sulfobacillus thermosulfidooxidans TaxID=28034 RepID=UPI000687A068|nr:hypothetical protein [Sulfobacillus thermosulfidooxidans]OLZ08146.1 hypothetical protein BFX05_05075 [Sulfobacillus thermosulfidooxidans]OLZ14994.1 hypothetical protein BFX06_05175 [Sulfobacillus thermosulfidooxidans]OLZ19647.1 hypothetical protein BFX07_03035 [Sulfobacillus thermosulfidooxidans]